MSTHGEAESGPVARMTALVKERHQTGAYGDCHFVAARDVVWELRGAAVPLDTPPPLTGELGHLLGIPVVVDEGADRGSWRLVRRDGSVVERWPARRRRWWQRLGKRS